MQKMGWQWIVAILIVALIGSCYEFVVVRNERNGLREDLTALTKKFEGHVVKKYVDQCDLPADARTQNDRDKMCVLGAREKAREEVRAIVRN